MRGCIEHQASRGRRKQVVELRDFHGIFAGGQNLGESTFNAEPELVRIERYYPGGTGPLGAMHQVGHFLGLIVGGLPIAPHAQRQFTAKTLKKLKGAVTRTVIDHQDARHPLGVQMP